MNSEDHICLILLRTVIWKDGECTEDCKEEDCPISEVKSFDI